MVSVQLIDGNIFEEPKTICAQEISIKHPHEKCRMLHIQYIIYPGILINISYIRGLQLVFLNSLGVSHLNFPYRTRPQFVKKASDRNKKIAVYGVYVLVF